MHGSFSIRILSSIFCQELISEPLPIVLLFRIFEALQNPSTISNFHVNEEHEKEPVAAQLYIAKHGEEALVCWSHVNNRGHPFHSS